MSQKKEEKRTTTIEEDDELTSEQKEMVRKRGQKIPDNPVELEKYIDSFPLMSTQRHDEDKDNVDFQALEALISETTTPVERATNLKDSGNLAYRLGKKDKYRYKDAIEYYTQALDVKCPDAKLNAIIYSNRAMVHLTLDNYGNAITDCIAALKLDPSLIKAYYRAASGSLKLDKYEQCVDFCQQALSQASISEEDKKQIMEIHFKGRQKLDLQLAKEEKKRQENEKLLKQREMVQRAIKTRGIIIGAAEYQYDDQVYKGEPYVDDKGTLHWPVIFLYPEYQYSDFIADFNERDKFEDHINAMFPPNAEYAPWDKNREYTADNIVITYDIMKPKTLSSKLETKERKERNNNQKKKTKEAIDFEKELEKWKGSEPTVDDGKIRVEVPLNVSLYYALSNEYYILPAIPTFHIRRRNSFSTL